jgi:hypothetical protein
MQLKNNPSRSSTLTSTQLRIVVVLTIFIIFGAYAPPLASSQPSFQQMQVHPTVIDGEILFAPMTSDTTYLIDENGTVKHTWPSDYLPGEAVRWLGNGTILRSIKVGLSGYGGSGGGFQEVRWDGTITWDFRYNTEGNLSHHDLLPLPNGNILLIAWETKTRSEAIAEGRDPSHLWGDTFMPDEIIEVHKTGQTSGTIVWEWHAWDHLIQDFDASKQNYGAVAEHPELIDLNFGEDFQGVTDWLHTNSVDYNPAFDQILLCVHNFNEIWVIDHSTTTEEAAGHTGGRYGHGGDLLYRWGNPQAYRAGLSNDQIFYGPHDATWIPQGYPGEGHMLVFNNGLNRPGSLYSTVDEFIPPVNATGFYYLESGSAYGPAERTWMYTANPPTSFYATQLSGAQRLKDGDTLICNGEAGNFFEVTPTGTTVWEYTNPYPNPQMNRVFKIVYIPTGDVPQPRVEGLGSITWKRVKPGAIITGSFQVQNNGSAGSMLNWKINTSAISWGSWSCTPAQGENLTPEAGPVTIDVTVAAPNETWKHFSGYVRIEDTKNPNDFDQIPISLTTSLAFTNEVAPPHTLIWLLQHKIILAGLLFLKVLFEAYHLF